MKLKSLPLVRKFWQEIIFALALAPLVFGMTMNASKAFHQVFNIISYCIFILLIACLVGQFYWKSLILSIWLACLFGLGSIYMTIGWLVELVKMKPAEEGYVLAMFALFFSLGLTAVSISMPFKYMKSD
jgi:hypothetical protein